VRTLIREQPQIDRVSIAVMIDGLVAPGADGKPAWQPRSPEDMTRITALVKSAIGFDEKRGDVVEVASMRFAGEDAPPAEAGGLLGIALDKADMIRLAQTALFGIIGLLALLLVLRPMVFRLTTMSPGTGGIDVLTEGEGGALAALAAAGVGGIATGGHPALAGGVAGLLEDDSLVNVAQIEGQMRASSLRKLVDLVEKHPNETLTIMRGWMAQENG